MSRILALVLAVVAVCYSEEQTHNSICKGRNGYYPVEGSCDAYIECRDYIASEMLCPDGLHYNPDVAWPSYACGYPMDVPCIGRGSEQKARPTADCLHQYGFFPSPHSNPSNCGQYRMCVEGRPLEMMCPSGLAFNAERAQCDYPDLVKGCDADSFLGFKCPAPPLGIDGKPLDTVINYQYEGNCYAFYSCHEGRARLLTCDAGFAFDPNTGHCENAEHVACSV